MGGKAKPTKHTSAELKKKNAEAVTNKGGGVAGLVDRKGGAAGHAKYKCNVCGQAAPDLKARPTTESPAASSSKTPVPLLATTHTHTCYTDDGNTP